ncbi:MAG: aromatic ring-hydroxylating oxygenase subunit alpha [Planctomycetota bacterium]|jgi:choline monooxygenase
MPPREPSPQPASTPTPDSTFYRDDARLRRLEQAVFPASWQWLPGAEDFLEPGNWRPLTMLEGCLDEPLLQARDAGGALHLLSNACTHRGARLCTTAGSGARLRCPYHGRRFGLDGRCQGAPGFETVPDFPAARDHLVGPETAGWGPLHFARLLAEGPTFADWCAPLDTRLSFLPWAEAREDPEGRRTFEVEAHWSLYVENYLEGFHIAYVHPGLARELDLEDYPCHLFPGATLQVGIARADAGAEAAFTLPADHPDAGQAVAAFYFWMWPNLMLNVYPWGLSVNLVEPRGSTRCLVRYRRYLFADAPTPGAGGALDEVEREDQGIVAEVQRGVRARLYRGGRTSPTMEPGVAHFHRLLAQAESGLS